MRLIVCRQIMRVLFACRSHHWNLVEFLPPALQEHAIVALAEFMYRPWAAAAARAREGATQGGSQAAVDAKDSKAVQVRALRFVSTVTTFGGWDGRGRGGRDGRGERGRVMGESGRGGG
jgi:hypothetical protein